ncbi:YceI family protein [Ekhidna sp.]
MKWFSIWVIGLVAFQIQSLENAAVTFKVAHMGVLKVEGKLDDVKGEITRISDQEWSIVGEVDPSSISTGNSTRDETILGEQYLNIEDYPAIPFEVRVRKDGEKYFANIDLQLRGIEMALAGSLYEKGLRLVSEPIIFKRSEVGLDFGLMDSLIGDEITIVIKSGIAFDDLD